MKLLQLLFDWSALAEQGADAVVYMVMAVAGTLLFLIRLGLAMFGGGDSDFDTEVDAGVDSDVAFTLFSVLSILAFFMGSGWMGLACRLDWGMSRLASSMIAAGFGFSMMIAASGLTYATRKLNREVHYDVSTAVGHTARVYLTVPETGKGHGQVEVVVSGRKKVLQAVSPGPRIEAFTDVKIVDVRDDETLVVEPLQ